MQELSHLAIVAWQYLTVHHAAILALFGGAAGLWAVIQTFLVKLHINGPRISFVISHIAAFLTALATYWLSSANPNVGITYGWLWIILQGWHHLILNPNYNKYFVPLLNMLSSQKTIAAPAVTPPVAPAGDGLE